MKNEIAEPGPGAVRDLRTAPASAGAAELDRTPGGYLIALPWGLDAIGGVTQVVVGLYDALKKDGRLAPFILDSSWDEAPPSQSTDAAGRIIVRWRARSLVSSFGGVARYLAALPSELHRIRTLVKRHSIEVVNCHYLGSSDLTWVIAKWLGLYRGKLLLSMHGLDIRNLAALHGARWALWRWALRRADAVVACSEGLATETVERFRLAKSHVVTIHNGVDIARVTRLLGDDRAEPAPPRGRPMLLNLGTFERKKGHDLLLKAFRKVIETYPAAHLTIMGRRGETTESTFRLVDELGLKDHTTLCTDVPHPVALGALRTADVFVLSSRNEAFSVALLEAGALGKPVVAASVCGVAELIQDGVTGIRVPPEDVDALAEAMLRMLADEQAAAECGRRLRELVATKFTLEENGRNYLRLAGYPPR